MYYNFYKASDCKRFDEAATTAHTHRSDLYCGNEDAQCSGMFGPQSNLLICSSSLAKISVKYKMPSIFSRKGPNPGFKIEGKVKTFQKSVARVE